MEPVRVEPVEPVPVEPVEPVPVEPVEPVEPVPVEPVEPVPVEPVERANEPMAAARRPRRCPVVDTGFFAVAAAHPDRPALVDPAERVHTYGELVGAANRFSRGLRR